MTNEQLVIRIKAGIDTAESSAQLYDQTHRFIHFIAWKYRAYEDIEDLEQEGYLALYDAIDGYDPDMGYRFLTYAEYWIRQRIQRYIQNNSCCLHASIHTQDRIRRYKKLCDTFLKEYNRKPIDDEIGYHMELTLDQIQNLKKDAKRGDLDSLDRTIEGTEEGQLCIGDIIPSDDNLEEEVVERMQQEQLKLELWKMVDSLEGRQPDVIRKRFIDNRTLDDIGRDYGVSRDAIRQVESKALRKLRQPKYAGTLRTYADVQEVRDRAMTGVGIRRFNETWTSATERIALERLERVKV